MHIPDPYQSSYKKALSTQTALIRILDDVRHAGDRREVTVAVFFYFTKAFDWVDHRLLINRLRDLGFSCSALRWLCSYLCNWKQAVQDHISGKMTHPLRTEFYLLRFGEILKNCKYNFHADDLLIYLSTKPENLCEAICKVNEDIVHISSWTLTNKLKLNPRKTVAMILGTAKYINSINVDEFSQVRVDDAVIPYSNSVEYLGFTISNTLSWNKQITKVCSRINASLHQLKICKKLLPFNLRCHLISTLIFPLIDYCCATLMDIPGQLNLRLQRSLNAGIRFIFQVGRDEHISPYYEKLKWLKIKYRRDYFVCCQTFTILYSREPAVLYNGFEHRRVG
ncbi:uncharacterized protein LOC118647926 [Monomorium pharaonis]|uniref:uncharacterized protein LOC118647926 n=1 Tax=Monomorium pharaonis TaxID=307658 RepID=UPI001746D26C|nr:uncharacterized protein LOC118647926 [Monomorium pharaonis]